MSTSKKTTPTIRTKKALARRLKIARNTLDRYLSMPGAPRPLPGKGWVFGEVLAFIGAHATRETTAATDRLRALREHEVSLRCRKLSFEIATNEGRYLLKDHVIEQIRRCVGATRNALLGLPASLAPSVVGLSVPECELRIRCAIDEALDLISDGSWPQ